MKGFFFGSDFSEGGSLPAKRKRGTQLLSFSSIYLKIRRDLSIYLSGNEMSSCASARSPPYASYFHSLFFSWWLPHFVKAGNNNSPGPSMLKKREREKKHLKKGEWTTTTTIEDRRNNNNKKRGKRPEEWRMKPTARYKATSLRLPMSAYEWRAPC